MLSNCHVYLLPSAELPAEEATLCAAALLQVPRGVQPDGAGSHGGRVAREHSQGGRAAGHHGRAAGADRRLPHEPDGRQRDTTTGDGEGDTGRERRSRETHDSIGVCNDWVERIT